ncbi:hypothetical protein DPX16_13908 [Anabarilius grahami]|uniref:Uncharacterized protein n=1 Tax=Anabarilius grahami TaxID=495550 RepID=A0A3N0Y993_ANAGA|nr:hypothetical protein DPX16_13908 [Anabarilius grahami]
MDDMMIMMEIVTVLFLSDIYTLELGDRWRRLELTGAHPHSRRGTQREGDTLETASLRWPGFFGPFVCVVLTRVATARLESVLCGGPRAASGIRRGALSPAARPPLPSQ